MKGTELSEYRLVIKYEKINKMRTRYESINISTISLIDRVFLPRLSKKSKRPVDADP